MAKELPIEPEIEKIRGDMRTASTSGSQRVKRPQHGPMIRDTIIGFADGLTVPFALTAGLSSLGSSKLVIIGGLAELFSGAISMSLGAYLAATTDRDYYLAEKGREEREILDFPEDEKEEIFEVMRQYGITRESTRPLVEELVRNPIQWVNFTMHFELQLACPKVSRAWISAATMGFAYFIGGLVPMIPYFAMADVTKALYASIAITVVVLLVFGYTKGHLTVRTKRAEFFGALQTLIVGALAAGTSYGIVRALDTNKGYLSA